MFGRPLNIGFLLLGIYLIIIGLSVFGLAVPGMLTAVIALLAGIFILIGR